MKYFDAEEVKKAVDFMAGDSVFECRILYNNGYIKSGYFNGSDKLIEELNKVNLENCNVYITLNELHNGVFSRVQRNRLVDCRGKVITTSDNDVIGYKWLFVDLDPIRPAGISSSKEEILHAEEVMKKVLVELNIMGFTNDDIKICFSGNGFHILAKLEADNTKETENTISNCLKSLDVKCSDSKVKVDVTNSNPARICKLYGTLAQKGSNTEERPFRMSRTLIYDFEKGVIMNEQ